jgi:general secretion pathway protein A
LTKANEYKKRVLLIVDEAQRLNQQMLEEIRLLSNIEKQDSKLINIFFIGQNEFNDLILQPVNRAIRQRITINYHLRPLSLDETGKYIQHRLKVAGAKQPIFNPESFREVFLFSQGFPRLINVLCDHALLTGFVREAETIDRAIIRECARELQIEPQPINDPWNGTHKSMNQTAPSETPDFVQEIEDEPETPNNTIMYTILTVLIIMAVIISGYLVYTGTF